MSKAVLVLTLLAATFFLANRILLTADLAKTFVERVAAAAVGQLPELPANPLTRFPLKSPLGPVFIPMPGSRFKMLHDDNGEVDFQGPITSPYVEPDLTSANAYITIPSLGTESKLGPSTQNFGLTGGTIGPISGYQEKSMSHAADTIGPTIAAERHLFDGDEYVKPMRVVITLSVMGVALFVILSGKYKPQDKHWAFGIVGTLIGYYFHSLP